MIFELVCTVGRSAVELKRELEDLKRQSGAREEQAVDRQEQGKRSDTV
jgi:hypothetical protein